jgi:AraC-like DNA-binding protein
MYHYATDSHTGFLTGIFFDAANSLWLQLFSITAYHILAFRFWYLHENAVKNNFSNFNRLQFQWLRSFIVISFFVCTIISLAIYFMYVNFPHWSNVRFLFVALTFFIYWISYTALSQPSVFSVIKGQPGENHIPALSPKLIVHRPAKKYSNSGLNEEDVLRINSVLQKIMVDQKPYLNPELSINDLAGLVKCNRHHLSQVLNESLQQSFYDYVNNCRVEEAKQLLLDPSKDGHKIASIAYDAGFNSLSAFNDVFKKRTGSTPSQFRKEVHPTSKQQRG